MPVAADPTAAADTTDGCEQLSLATRAVLAGRPTRIPGAPLNEPLMLSSTYVAGAEPAYGRFGNRTWSAFEAAVAALEGGRALAFASGMGAVSAVLSVAFARVAGPATVIAPHQAYSGTLTALPIDARVLVDIADTDAVLAALDAAERPVACLWIESPTNPGMAIAEVATLVTAARRRGVLTVVDNTFATPLGQTPLADGADVVVHSATKLLSGHSDVLLGVVVTADDTLHTELETTRRQQGAVPSPFDTWLALRGLRTLSVRLERAGANAGVLATRLAMHPAVRLVRYPGLATDPGHERARALMRAPGTIMCAEFHGGVDAAEQLCAGVRVWVPATSLGGVESTLERRRRWPAESDTVDPSLVRFSVGVEAVDDLWADLERALANLPGP